jgi:hypothetical protein
MKDIEQTILSQYQNSGAICTIIQALNQVFDPTSLIDSWYNNVWNVATATGYGLDVWGRIVGVNRTLTLSAGDYFGFREADDLTEEGFNTQPFYSGSTDTSNYALSDNAFRTLIYAKAYANISDVSVTSINRILQILFKDSGGAYVEDNLDMSINYVFEFTPADAQIAIIENAGILPKPAGVAISYTIKESTST